MTHVVASVLPDLQPYNLPEDPLWMQDKMRIRHMVGLYGQSFDLERAVGMLDEHAHKMGCRRHGQLEYETWDHGRYHGLTTHYAMYDLGKFVEFTRDIARASERRRVLAEVRALPWWRRLFMATYEVTP